MRYIPIDNQGMGGPEPEEDPRLRKMFNLPGAGYMPAHTPQPMPQPVMPQLSFAPDVQMPPIRRRVDDPPTGGVKTPPPATPAPVQPGDNWAEEAISDYQKGPSPEVAAYDARVARGEAGIGPDGLLFDRGAAKPPAQSVGSAVAGGMDAAKQGGGKSIFDKIKSIGA